MAGEIDHSKHSESELVEIFGRLDPRFAPEKCARLGKVLTDLGYLVTQGDTGPGFAMPSAFKMQALIGVSAPARFDVEFGNTSDASSYFDPTYNDFGVAGSGTLTIDGIFLHVFGRTRNSWDILSAQPSEQLQVPLRTLTNVERAGVFVRFEYRTEGGAKGILVVQLRSEIDATSF